MSFFEWLGTRDWLRWYWRAIALVFVLELGSCEYTAHQWTRPLPKCQPEISTGWMNV